jgi:hypothetical protein
MNYLKIQRNVLRLVKKYGQQVTWRQNLLTPVIETPVYAVFLPAESNTNMSTLNNALESTLQNAVEVPSGLIYVIMGYNGFEPNIRDSIVRGTDIHYVNSIDTISPAGIPVLYSMLFNF